MWGADQERQAMATAASGTNDDPRPAGNDLGTADDVRAILYQLVSQRQQLRAAGATRPALEANRLAIVYWQARLGKILGAAGGSAPGNRSSG
jgi:hypothetical protein